MRPLRRSILRSTARRLRKVAPTVGATFVLAALPAAGQTRAQDDIVLPGVDVRGRRQEYRTDQSDLLRLPSVPLLGRSRDAVAAGLPLSTLPRSRDRRHQAV